jgi:site-specific DNA-methyltransferase (adenine-specific)
MRVRAQQRGPGSLDLRPGSWQDVFLHEGDGQLGDALVSDPPYSVATHAGHNAGRRGDGRVRRELGYQPWGRVEVEAFVTFFSPRIRGWFVVFCDDELVTTWKRGLRDAGRYVFAALPFVEPGSRVRLRGDGPSSWTCWIVVARPRTREFVNWGTLPGAYVAPKGTRERLKLPDGMRSCIGHKTQWIMRSLIRDYTRPGDLVVDPCAGGGSTLIAAVAEGRHAVGAEIDPASCELARWRMEEARCR